MSPPLVRGGIPFHASLPPPLRDPFGPPREVERAEGVAARAPFGALRDFGRLDDVGVYAPVGAPFLPAVSDPPFRARADAERPPVRREGAAVGVSCHWGGGAGGAFAPLAEEDDPPICSPGRVGTIAGIPGAALGRLGA